MVRAQYLKKLKFASGEMNKVDHKKFEDWFKEIYDDKFERLYRYAFSITKNKQLAEDAISEVFLVIWQNKNYKDIKQIDAYLHVSVKHAAISLTSKNPQKFDSFSYDEVNDVASNINPEHILIGRELDSVIEDLVDKLPEHIGITYSLIKNQGYSNKEAALELGVSKRTVEANLYQAVRRIKEGLFEHFKEVNIKGFVSKAGMAILLLLSV